MEGIQLDEQSPTSELARIQSNYLMDEPPEYEPPPSYEAPPDYEEAIKMYKEMMKNNYDKIIVDRSNEEPSGRFCLYY